MKTICEIKDRLLEHKPLLVSQQQYLIDLAQNLEQGIPAAVVIEHTKIIPKPRGKQSTQYKKAVRLRNSELKKACSLFDGKLYPRCEKLSLVIKEAKRKLKTGSLKPLNNVEQIVLQLITSGVTIPDTPRQLYEIIFAEKLNI